MEVIGIITCIVAVAVAVVMTQKCIQLEKENKELHKDFDALMQNCGYEILDKEDK